MGNVVGRIATPWVIDFAAATAAKHNEEKTQDVRTL